APAPAAPARRRTADVAAPPPVVGAPVLPLLPPGPGVDVDALRAAVAVAAGRAAALLRGER
ncbi:hypothetical protein, partial [Micromonospora sp. NPDC023644]|uniref:hypothetical protein n=1 Tax=Micromonospora sp. NPDC023644 TaxID=3154321 RepID=UPI0034011357